jgi:hypothetical protein
MCFKELENINSIDMADTNFGELNISFLLDFSDFLEVISYNQCRTIISILVTSFF